MSFEEQYDSGRYGVAPPPSQRYDGGQPAFGFASADQAAFGPPGTTARPPTATAVPSGPYMRVVRASYGAGIKLIDVTATLQQLIFNKGGLTLDAFGYTLQPNGCMNALFGDPAPGEDKQLLFSFEVVGTPKLLTKPEDIKMTLTMDHLYTKTTGKSSPPEEVKLFCADIVKASYGLENRVYDVTTTLRIMLSEQGGKGLRAFGYTIKPNGCMNKAFGDPAPGKDKILTVEYLWRTPVLAYAIDEDKKVSLNFEALRPLL